MKRKIYFALFLFIGLGTGQAFAQCTCECVGAPPAYPEPLVLTAPLDDPTCASECTFLGYGSHTFLAPGQCFCFLPPAGAPPDPSPAQPSPDAATCNGICTTQYGYLSSTCAPLPVEMVSFKGYLHANGRTIGLSWITASESENFGFDIERSKDGSSWETLSFVEGNGTTAEESNYVWMDQAPLEGLNYYRLKQINLDGSFEYSKIILVNKGAKESGSQIFAWPNPAKDLINFQVVGKEDYPLNAIAVYDVSGKMVLQGFPQSYNIGTSQAKLDISVLPKGTYFLSVYDGEEILTKKFVKL